ncbi:MAG: membrane protein insertion efficiency factor YidD [Candidatus Latescibacteria bacterium]|nr:membrane protein insertion efficiency factor YidD [Candidatus Latescibacterota bacterium]
MTRLALLSIRIYRNVISPWLPATCRFVPSCSAYAHEAVERFGPWRGTLLAARRLLHCRPWGGHGYDPVPEAGSTCRKGRRG